MSDIALPAFHITKTTRFTVEADYALTQDLAQYRQFYRSVYGVNVTEKDLIREMARRFMENDRDFQSFKQPRSRPRRSRPRPAERQTPAQTRPDVAGPDHTTKGETP